MLVFLYCASLPIESIAIGGFGTLPYLPAVGMVVLARWGAISPRRKQDWLLFRPLLIIGPLVLAALSALWTIDPSATFGRVVTLIGLVSVTLAIVSTGDENSLRFGLPLGFVSWLGSLLTHPSKGSISWATVHTRSVRIGGALIDRRGRDAVKIRWCPTKSESLVNLCGRLGTLRAAEERHHGPLQSGQYRQTTISVMFNLVHPRYAMKFPSRGIEQIPACRPGAMDKKDRISHEGDCFRNG